MRNEQLLKDLQKQANLTSMFARLTKVDESKREVWGVLAEEQVDKSGEIFDYASSKKYFEAWSDGFVKATKGKSFGNLRLMHQPIVVGKLISIEYRDAEKEIYIGAKVTDDEAWKMVEEGVLTGFSIGGVYVKVWEVNQIPHYTAAPAEASIVDNPCMYGATFDAVKADGTVDVRKFVGGSTKEELHKGMWEVADLACLLSSLNSVRARVQYEEAIEQDGSPIGGELKQAVDNLADILVRMLKEEAAELTADAEEATYVELAAKVEDLSKATDEDRARKLVDLAEGIRKLAPKSKEAPQKEKEMEKSFDDLMKAFDEKVANINKSVDEKLVKLAENQNSLAETVKKSNEDTNKAVADLAGAVKAVTDTIVKMSGAPASKPVLKVVGKEGDTGTGGALETATEDKPRLTLKAAQVVTDEMERQGKEKSLDAIKKIHATGGQMVRPGDNRFLVLAR